MQAVLAVLLVLREARCLEKRLLSDVDWRRPGNWLGGSVPGDDSRVVFPLEMRHAAGLPHRGRFRLAGLELPRDGVVALPENGRLAVSRNVGICRLIFFFFFPVEED